MDFRCRLGRVKRQTVFCLALSGLLFALNDPIGAQQQAKLVKIGWLGVAVSSTGIELFRRELRNLGHLEGKNIVIEARFANNKLDQLSVLADELVRLKVDLLVVPSTPGALAAKNATTTIPIIFIGSGDPVTAGLVDSLPRPGGNITGFTTVGSGWLENDWSY
jgi:putative tryptophan/tyrosine transport system substrate-binding protein